MSTIRFIVDAFRNFDFMQIELIAVVSMMNKCKGLKVLLGEKTSTQVGNILISIPANWVAYFFPLNEQS